MNVLERFLRAVAPMAAARRASAQLALRTLDAQLARTYEGASRSNRTKGWRADSTDANAEIGDALDLLRARHRQLVRDNPWASRAVRVITNHAIGAGIVARSTADSTARARRLNAAWRAWSESIESDVGEQLNIDGQTRLAFRGVVEGGDVLLRRIWIKDWGKRNKDGPAGLPFQVQLLEGDHLATDVTQLEDKDGNFILQGVEFDASGRRTAYHLYKRHPGAPWPRQGREISRVPASDIKHPYRLDRIGQVRGVPWGAPAMLRLRDWDLYEDAQLLRQRIAACFVAFEHDITGDPDSPQAKVLPGVTKGGAKDGADTQHLEPGSWERLSAGRTISFAVPPGVQGYRENFEINALAVATAYGLTYQQLTGDLSRANYSSMRSGHVEQRSEVDEWRWHLAIPRISRPLWDWFVEGALIAGLVEPARDLRQVDFTPPRVELLDPSIEIPAAIKGVRAGFTSWSEQLRGWGSDPEQVAQELAADMRRFDELGIAVDSDGRRPQQGGAPNPPELVEQDPDAAERARRELERLRAG